MVKSEFKPRTIQVGLQMRNHCNSKVKSPKNNYFPKVRAAVLPSSLSRDLGKFIYFFQPIFSEMGLFSIPFHLRGLRSYIFPTSFLRGDFLKFSFCIFRDQNYFFCSTRFRDIGNQITNVCLQRKKLNRLSLFKRKIFHLWGSEFDGRK